MVGAGRRRHATIDCLVQESRKVTFNVGLAACFHLFFNVFVPVCHLLFVLQSAKGTDHGGMLGFSPSLPVMSSEAPEVH